MQKLLILASILGTASLAHAEPTSYVQGGATLGGDHVGIFGAYTAEGGYRLTDNGLWAHAMVASGGMGGVDETTYASEYLVARAGIESRGCAFDGAVCGVLGVDAAARHEMLMDEYDSGRLDGIAAIPRVGFDLGGTHLRFRAGLEGIVDQRGLSGASLVSGIAYQW